MVGSAWLARQLFPGQSINYDTINMNPRDRQQARWLTNAVALVFAVHYVASQAFLPLSGLAERSGSLQRIPLDFAEEAAVVYNFVLITVAAALLFKLGNLLRRLKPWSDRANTAYRHRVLAWAGKLTRIVSILAVALTSLGFVNLGNLATWPWLQSLALIGLLVLLQDFIADVFNMLKRGQEGARDGLAYVSPRSGRAVSREGAGEWADRLLPLPGMLGGAGDNRGEGLAEGLAITGHFLTTRIAGELVGRPVPAARQRLVDRLARGQQKPGY